MRNNKTTIRAFTLVEMLTTVAIIGILLAVLIPAFNQVSKTAMRVKQRAQFQNIEIALETFRSDTGDYPPSVWDVPRYGQYSAAERLAEAVVGRDGFGFHPASRFRADGKGDIDGDGVLDPTAPNSMIYNAIDGVICSSGYVQTAEENRAVRKGPYLELENANAVRLSDYGLIYEALTRSKPPSLVLADVFKTAKLTTGRKTGRPILYYRANRLKTGHSADTIGANTYAYEEGNVIATPTNAIATSTGKSIEAGWFYQRTRNPNFTDPPRPYRAESFILHSAGPDGVYGTTDDMFNFDERE